MTPDVVEPTVTSRVPPHRAVAASTPRSTTARAAGAVLFLSFLDVFALLPTVAPHVRALGAGSAAIGLAVGAYSALNLPANVVGGIMVDRIGRRRVALLGLVLASAAVAAYTLATSVEAFIAVRALHGIAGGILVPAVFAAAGDRARSGEAGRSFGRLGALIGAAAVVAPATAGAVRQVAGTDAVFLGVAVLLLVGFVVAWVGVHDAVPLGAPHSEPAPSPHNTPADGSTSPVIGAATSRDVEVPPAPAIDAHRAMRALLGVPSLRRALGATIVLTAAVGALAAFLPGTAEELGAPPSVVGGLFTAYAVLAAALMLSPLSGRVDREGADRNVALGLAVLAAALGLLVVTPNLAGAVVGSALFGAGYGLVFPAVTGATSLVSGTATRGRAFGLFNAAFSVGIAVGPPTIGAIAQRSPAIDPLAPAAVLCLLAAVWITASRLRRGPETLPGSRRSDTSDEPHAPSPIDPPA